MGNIKKIDSYLSWKGMNDRCYCKTNVSYMDYGGRGITVCDRWRGSFLSFMEDMGPRPTKKHSIDRIDNDGNYEKGNCKWSTNKEQANNKRSSHWIEYNGARMTLKQWAECLGAADTNVLSNKKRTVSENIEHYLKYGKRRMVEITYNGITKGTAEWSKELSISRKRLSGLLRSNQFEEIYKKYKL